MASLSPQIRHRLGQATQKITKRSTCRAAKLRRTQQAAVLASLRRQWADVVADRL